MKNNVIDYYLQEGKIYKEKEVLNDFGILYADSIIEIASNFDDAMVNSYNYLSVISSKFAKSISNNSAFIK